MNRRSFISRLTGAVAGLVGIKAIAGDPQLVTLYSPTTQRTTPGRERFVTGPFREICWDDRSKGLAHSVMLDNGSVLFNVSVRI